MKMKLYYMAWLFAALFAVGCEDLEDTYDEYAGDGMIRYLGKCSNVDVQPGWERLRVVWKNNLDATVKRVKITWQSEKESQPFVRFIERQDVGEGEDLMDTIYLENLQDAIYTVKVSNLSADSTESIVEERYGRPYTLEHEDLRTFTRGIVNFYVLGDKLAVVVDEDNENLKEMELHYWGTDQQSHVWNIKEHMTDSIYDINGDRCLMRNYMFLLPGEGENHGIDFNKPLVVKREGKLTGCIDEINFKDEDLDLQEKVWSPSFILWLTKTYGPNWESEINSIKEVKLDYDMSTFQDLLYFPKLEKVVLGNNRYMDQETIDEWDQEDLNLSVTDEYKGLMTLQFLKTIAEESGKEFTVERYNEHYFFGIADEEMWNTYAEVLEAAGKIESGLIKEMGNPNVNGMLASITPLDSKDWTVTCSDTTYNGDKDGGGAWLLDDDPTTYFEPGETLGATIYEVKFDMKKSQTLHGFKVVQPTGWWTGPEYLLQSLKIEVSEDGYNYVEATYEDGGSTIGASLGETTFIKVAGDVQGKSWRYIRLTMASRHIGNIGGQPKFSLQLGDFIPY